jgi:HemY protein
VIRALLLVAVLTALGAGAAWIADRPGRIAVDWEGWRIETEAGVAIALLLAAALAATIVLGTFKRVLSAPAAFARWRARRRREGGYVALTRGLVAVAAGDGAEAQRQARRAAVLLDEPPLVMLLAAQAAQAAGDDVGATRQYQAMVERPETEFLGLRGLIAQARRRGDDAEALRLVERARALRPKAPWVHETLLQLQSATGQWSGAERTLEAMPRGAQNEHRRAVVLLAQARAAASAGETKRAAALAAEAARAAPDLAPAAAEAARHFAAAGEARKARKTLEAAWRASPHPEIAAAWAALRSGDSPRERLAAAREFAALAPAHPESQMLVGEAAIAARDFALARDALEAARRAADGRRVHRLLAELDRAELGEAAAEEELRRVAAAPADPVWRCASCRAEAASWAPQCPRCGALDGLAWSDGRLALARHQG